jgi:hypothetical protein
VRGELACLTAGMRSQVGLELATLRELKCDFQPAGAPMAEDDGSGPASAAGLRSWNECFGCYFSNCARYAGARVTAREGEEERGGGPLPVPR